ncbi:MAG: ABC transporter ATP-binding protein [Candidatus Omnitrophica bacterium]|nr:ABC transporter ATP-binding protein [Candidatus Omnitrophota bacterium]MDD5610328.1 ABC transporter ATP-binding protein [Candidatus Omnitrophota bacterium]
MKECIIKTEKLTKVYKLPAEQIQAVKDIDLEICKRDFIAIMGPSGSGKTTLLDSLGCLGKITSGKLSVMGKNVSQSNERTLVSMRRRFISFVFQDFLLIPSLTALENVELPLYFARVKHDRQRSIDLLQKVGLGQRINHLPKQLSGGEKQRVAIARALATCPQVLLADEPTGNLDTKSSQEIFDLFKKLNKEDGLTLVVTTHNPKLGSQANRIIYLKDGRIVSPEESSLHI